MKYHKRDDISISFGYVEDTLRRRLTNWMSEVLKEIDSPLEYVDSQIEIKTSDGSSISFPDFIVWWKKNRRVVCLIELKPPLGWTHDYILNDAQRKATMASPQIEYIGTWNINELFLWKTFDPEARSVVDRRVRRYEVTKIRNLKEIDKPIVEKQIKEFLRKFFKDLEEVYLGKSEISKPPVDEFFIASLHSTVDAFDMPISLHLMEVYEKDNGFRTQLNGWFIEQGWTLPSSDEDFERIARQFLYLLLDKLLFYNTLRLKYNLKQITIPEGIDSSEALKRRLQEYFDIAERVTGDYETVFATNFIEGIPLPDEIIPNFRHFINSFSKYDFSQIGLKDIGRIFDSLIPVNERHKLGQYFTRPGLVDLIIGFCVKSERDIVADFGCGAGTFLVRSYARLKTFNPTKSHSEVLSQLYGIDIAKFPAHLSTISLAIRNLASVENYPQIICKDFFHIYPTQDQKKLRMWLNIGERISTLSKGEKELYVPYMDAVVGNPPYTRQEELEDYKPEYKKVLNAVIKQDWGRNVILGKRAGVHAYFFLHGLKFLREEGRFGYVTSNSWLDVDYGKYLQEFFLTKTKIVAIIESKVERWFEEADVNTAVTILERCYSENQEEDEKRKKEREENVVKFVQLLKPLSEIIPQTDDDEKKFGSIEKLIKLIENKTEFYEDEKIRIFPKKQAELWKEGYDKEAGRYVGSKWGKYVRAPPIFFKIIEKGRDLLVPLKEIAEVCRGFTTGANEFFYLIDEDIARWSIEREFWMHPIEKDFEVPVQGHAWRDKGGKYFKKSQYSSRLSLKDFLREDGYVYWIPNYVVKSPRECQGVIVDLGDLKYRVLMIHKDREELNGTNVLKYIEWGEERGFHERPTCASRKRWYDLGERVPGKIGWPYILRERIFSILNSSRVFFDCEFFDVYLIGNSAVLSAILTSSYNFMLIEILTRSYGGGGGPLKIQVYELKDILVFDPFQLQKRNIKKLKKAFDRLSKRPIGSVFDEIGAKKPEDVSLDKVKPDRRELDKIIMGEILGLTEEEQLEVYRAVVNLVKSRIEKAESVSRKKKSRGSRPEDIAEAILREVDISRLKKFPEEYIPDTTLVEIVEVPGGPSMTGSDLNGFYVNIGGKRFNCEYPEKAEYIHYAVINGARSIKVPVNKKRVIEAVKKYQNDLGIIVKDIQSYLERYIPDRKLRKKVWFIISKRLAS